MPIYEYQCTKCGHKLEALQKISEEPLLECPACGKSALSKLISAASFRLKGGGWYETDFKTGKKKQLAESESAAPNGEKSGQKSGATVDSSTAKGDEKASGAKGAVKNKSKDSKKTSSITSSS